MPNTAHRCCVQPDAFSFFNAIRFHAYIHGSHQTSLAASSRLGACTIAMALVLANSAPLEPEIKLAQALADYEKILSDEGRKQLHNQGLPDTMAAINFTTLIDRECNERRRRCMGPRLITFLESIQQFSEVIDAFVSSHPEVAALVWGGVKLTLLVILYILPCILYLTVPGCKQLLFLFRPIVYPAHELGKTVSSNTRIEPLTSFSWIAKSIV